MKYVSVAELKSRLSHYLGMVKEGEAIYVTSHQKPVAQITHLPDRGRSLKIIPPKKSMEGIRDVKGIQIDPAVDVQAMLREDRDYR